MYIFFWRGSFFTDLWKGVWRWNRRNL